MERLCNIVLRLDQPQALLDDSRNDVQPGLHTGRVSLVFFVLVGFRHRIGPQALMLPFERVRHRLHVAGFDAR